MYVPKNHPDDGFEVATRVSNREIAYLLCSAFVGGVGYWCIIVDHVKPPKEVAWMDADDKKPKVWKNYDWPVTPGGAVIVAELEEWYEAECDGDTSKVKTYRIDREAIQRGLAVMQTKYAHHFANFMNESGDAITGDVFLQCCCGFEEGVRYG